jgi:hypothetical protein
MKKIFLLATAAMLMTGSIAFANGEKKNSKNNGKKACTEKPCPKPCPKGKCDKSKCATC